MATVLVVSAVLGFYYYRFREQLDILHTRNFRLLATMSSQIEDSIAGYVSAIDSIVQTDCADDVDPEGFLNEQTSIYPYHPAVDRCKTPAGRCFQIERDADHFTWMLMEAHRRAAPPPRTPPCKVLTEAHGKVNLSDDFGYFMPNDGFAGPFDLVLIATRTGDVIYQPPNAQIHLTNIQPLFGGAGLTNSEPSPDAAALAAGAAAGKKESKGSDKDTAANKTKSPNISQTTAAFETARQTSSLTSVELAGLTYEMYTQPVRLNSIGPLELAEKDWVLCALVRPRSLYVQALRIPYPVLLPVIGVVGILFLALPWIRIRLLSRYERILRSDVAFGILSAVVGAVLALAIPIYIFVNYEFRTRTKEQLAAISQRIESSFTGELKEMISYLRTADACLKNGRGCGQETDRPSRHRWTRKLILPSDPKGYAFTSVLFWTGQQKGRQVYKWSPFENSTPFLDLSTRLFFRRFTEEPPSRLDGLNFYLQGDLAPTTGTSQVIVGVEANQTPNPLAKDDPIHGAFLVAQARSLFRTVLPPGFGFCLVDSTTGLVEFHSDYRRNQNENLFYETDTNPKLRSAVFSGSGLVDTDYNGRRHLMLVDRIPNLENSSLVLIVYTDKLFYETLAAQTVIAAASLYGMYMAIVGLLVALTWMACRPVRLIELIWPRHEQMHRYACVALILSVFSLGMLAWIAFAPPPHLIYGTVLLSVMAAFLTLVRLSRSASWEMTLGALAGMAFSGVAWGALGWKTALGIAVFTAGALCLFRKSSAWKVSPLHHHWLLPLYTTTVFLGILATSVMPAAAFFRFAFRMETTLFLKYGQRRIGNQILERQRNMHWLRSAARLGSHLGVWDAVKDDTPGLYHFPFFQTRLQLVTNPEGKLEREPPLPLHLDTILKQLNPPVNSIASDVQAIITPNQNDEESMWLDAEPGHVSYRTKSVYGSIYRLDTTLLEDQVPNNAALWLAFSVLGGFYFMGLRSGLRRIFCLDWKMPKYSLPQSLPERITGNYVVLIRPSGGHSLDNRQDFTWLDFAKLGAAGSFDSTFPSGQSFPAAVVAVRNFDYALNDEELNQKKLQLIERIVYEHGMRIVLVSRIDPFQHLAGAVAIQTASPEPDQDASHKVPGAG